MAGCSVPAADRGADPDDTIPEQSSTTAPVERQDLAIEERLDGVLGYESPQPLAAGREGVVTWIPDEGTVIGRGEAIAEINGMTTRLLYGERPAWRGLAIGDPAGPDIVQLNDNLAAMGYANREDLPEDQFDWRTSEALRNWQEDLGLKRTGIIEVGDLMFLPSEIRVGDHETAPGAWVGPGLTLFQGTGVEQFVTVDLDPAGVRNVHPGLTVTVVLPDGTRVEGVVRSIGSVVSTSEPDGQPVVEVTFDLREPTSGDTAEHSDVPHRFDAGPVMVILERVLAQDVLVVPVGALLASSGGYSVELVTETGSQIVTVEPGQFADGMVAITGNVSQGDVVAVPA